MSTKQPRYTIRRRAFDRATNSPMTRIAGFEYQVIDHDQRRKIVARKDTEAQALDWIIDQKVKG